MIRSALVTAGVTAATELLDTAVEILAVPVDLGERAVVLVEAPLPLVLKIDTDPERAERERRALRLLTGRLPVPEIRFAIDSPALVTGLSFLPGGRLDQRGWMGAGQALRVIHDLEPAGWAAHPSHPDEILAWADSTATEAVMYGVLDEATTDRFLRRVGSIHASTGAGQSRVVHGDFSTEHVLIGPEVNGESPLMGLLDLGDVGVGDPVHDIAVLTLWHRDRLPEVLDGYQSDMAFTERAKQVLPLFRCLRFLTGALWLEQHGFNPTPFRVGLYEELLA
ncbi:MAG: aminoglycoside phosphotransferase family protein [Actinomycetia bacterium]|nr:aminoglycoside phosphotransferase family protein [Actinomycetes bacterium]